MTTPDTKRFYDSAPWKQARIAALERDGYTCGTCGHHATSVHHDPPLQTLWELGLDPLDLAFLFTRCRTCHGIEDGWRSAKPKPKPINRFKRWL